MDINVERIIQQALGAAWKLDKYQYLVTRVHDVSVMEDSKFKRFFNDFWRIFPYEKDMSQRVLETIEWAKENGVHGFKEVLERISPNDRVNKAAASKILATLDPSIAPYDGNVATVLGLRELLGNKQTKIAQAVESFDYIQNWYDKELVSPTGVRAVEAFDKALPDYKGIHPVKKLDFLLWSAGSKLDKPKQDVTGE